MYNLTKKDDYTQKLSHDGHSRTLCSRTQRIIRLRRDSWYKQFTQYVADGVDFLYMGTSKTTELKRWCRVCKRRTRVSAQNTTLSRRMEGKQTVQLKEKKLPFKWRG